MNFKNKSRAIAKPSDCEAGGSKTIVEPFLSKALVDIKAIAEFIFAALYAVVLRLSHKNPERVVIYYHSIKSSDAENFRRQMAWLSTNCTVVEPSRIGTAPANGGTLVAITIDDGFTSALENAAPILKEYALPAGFFIPAGRLGQKAGWDIEEHCHDRDDCVINQHQIKQLAKGGFEIFSHTLSHPRLTTVEDQQLETELVASKRALEQIVGHEICGISYPHGDYDDRVCAYAQRAAYKTGFTIEPAAVNGATDSMRIGRFLVSPRDSLVKFRLKIRGAYQALKFLRALKKSIVRSSGKCRTR
jgi:peptidoglycan/xylan/chitin deacetylase (PgdA/CDA1 family)